MELEGLQLGQYHLLKLLWPLSHVGRVYLAEMTTLPPRQVAIKLFSFDESSRLPSGGDRPFLRQVETIARLNHPAIVPLYDYGEVDLAGIHYFYIVMPFFPEGSLDQWWGQQRRTKLDSFSRPDPLSPQMVADVVQWVAEALQYAHEQQIIHQHVQVSNFLVRSKKASSHLPDLLLTDFVDVEIAKFRAGPPPFWSTISASVAPEQLRGNAHPASDQYALASIAYELLTGHPCILLHGNGMPELQILVTQPQPPSTLQPHLLSGLDAVLLSALRKKPEERFTSIAEFSRAFQQALIV